MKEVPIVRFSKPSHPELEFEVLKLSDLVRKEKDTKIFQRSHRLDFYNVLHITFGRGIHTIDFQNFRYKTGDTLLIRKGQVHSFLCPDEAEGILIVFTEKFFYKNIVKSDYLSFYSLDAYRSPIPIVHQPKNTENNLLLDAETIYNEYHFGDQTGKELMMQCLLKIFLIRLERCRSHNKIEQLNSEFVDRFRIFQNLLDKHCTEIREAETYSKMMNISYKHMNKICNLAVGNSMKKIIDTHIVLEMKRKLAISEISINELTEIFHFDEPTNLVKFFKKNCGMTPSRFRKTLLL